MRLKIIFLVLILGLINGCLTFRQSLVFHKDSTCIATYDYILPEQYVPLLLESGKLLAEKDGGGPPLTFFLDEMAAKKYFSSRGLEVRQYRQSKIAQNLHVQIIVLARDAPKAMQDGAFGTFKLNKDMLGDWHLSGTLARLPENIDPGELARWQKLCEGSSLSLNVTTPTAVIRSNGEPGAFNQVSWQYAWPATASASSLFAPLPAEVEVTW